MKFEDAHRTLAKWLNEEIEAPICRQSLAVVLATTNAKMTFDLVEPDQSQIRADFLAFAARMPDSPANFPEAIRSIKLIKGAALSALEKMESQQ